MRPHRVQVTGNSHCIEKKSVHTGTGKQRKTSSTVAGRINTPACLPGQPLTDLSGKLVFFVMQSDPTYSNSDGFQKRNRLPCVCREGNQVSRSSEISIPQRLGGFRTKLFRTARQQQCKLNSDHQTVRRFCLLLLMCIVVLCQPCSKIS